MKIGHVIAAIEVVINKYFPVAVDNKLAASGEMELIEMQRLELLDHVAEIFRQGHRIGIEMDEDKFLPHVNAERNQAILFAIKILHALEVGNAFERSIQSVGPAVIRALQAGGCAARFGHHGGRVMAADVEESAQFAILTADYQDRLSRNFCSDVLPGRRNLFRAANHLPSAAEYGLALKLGDASVGVPGAGNS